MNLRFIPSLKTGLILPLPFLPLSIGAESTGIPTVTASVSVTSSPVSEKEETIPVAEDAYGMALASFNKAMGYVSGRKRTEALNEGIPHINEALVENPDRTDTPILAYRMYSARSGHGYARQYEGLAEEILKEKIVQSGFTDTGAMLDYAILCHTGAGEREGSRTRAKVGVNYRLLDGKTGRILYSSAVEDSHSDAFGRDTSAQIFLNKACADVAGKVLKEMQKKNPIVGTVLDVSDKVVYIDLGHDSGIHEGDRLLVYKEGAPIMNTAGEIIATRIIEQGEVKVTEVNDSYSICHVTEFKDDNTPMTRGSLVKRIFKD